MRRSVLLVPFLLLFACGDDDATDPGDTTTTTEARETGDDTDTGTGDGDTTTTTEADDDGESASAPDDYCALSRELDESDEFGLIFGITEDGETATPEQVEGAVDSARAAFDELLEVAPDEIQDEAQFFVDLYDGYFEALEEFDYDVEAIPQDDPRIEFLTASFETGEVDPEIEAADQAIAEFNEEACGIDTDPLEEDEG